MNTDELVQISVDKLLEIAARNSVGIFDIISLITTVTLGILALVLAYFIYRLSDRFETRSTLALESIQTLATEIRQMIQSGVLDQKEMSNKMLESILGNYGTPSEDNQDKREKDVQILDKVSALIEAKLSTASAPEIEKEISEIKAEVQKISAARASKDEHIISDTLFRKISDFRYYPAFAILLDSILKHDATNFEQVENVHQKDSIPFGYKGGIEQLLEEDVLVGEENNFRPNPEFAEDLQAFFDVNSDVIKALRTFYKKRGATPQTDDDRKQERTIAKDLIF